MAVDIKAYRQVRPGHDDVEYSLFYRIDGGAKKCVTFTMPFELFEAMYEGRERNDPFLIDAAHNRAGVVDDNCN